MSIPRISCLLLAALSACGGQVTAKTETAPPSVVLISLDTLRAGHMSLYGYERETTPYLERFAEECLVFDQAKTVAPWTLISHVTMLTGLYPEQHGVVKASFALNPEIPFLTQRLSDYGYRTFGFYKPAFIGPRHGHERGFDVFEQHDSGAEAAENMAEHLADIARPLPYFLFLHLFDIHSAPLGKEAEMYYRPPAPFGTFFMEDAHEKLEGVDFRAAREREIQLTDEQLEAMVATYDGGIRYVDGLLETWIEGWRASGALDNTILIITADHGESLGQRNRDIEGHGKMWEDALHVPLIVRFPDGYRAGEREGTQVSIVDIVPTILDVVGLPEDQRLPGNSLRGSVVEDRVLGAHRPPLTARMLGPWKVIERKGRDPQLVNLEEDPLELNPITGSEAEAKLRELEERFQSDLASRPVFDAPPIPAHPYDKRMRAKLDALGYAGDH